jgi:GntR family transcriptional regulator, sialic acid-inducible nan operon repressor
MSGLGHTPTEDDLNGPDRKGILIEPGGSGGGSGSPLVGQQVRVPKTAELVAAQLRRQIVRGDLVEGDALPPEATLLEQFGVSRPTLREAFRVLESEALISVRRGAHGGARVHTPNGEVAARYAALVLEHRGTTLGDIFAARAILEAPSARMLAEQRTESDLAALRAALAQEEEAAEDPVSLRHQEHLFHMLVVQLAGNNTLVVLSAMLNHILDRVSLPQAHVDRDAVRAHENLIQLIEKRDGPAAQAAWHEHLTQAEEFGTLLDFLG